MSKEFARCPHPECDATIPVPRHLVDGGPKLCLCRCHAIRVVPMRDGNGQVVLKRVLPVSEKPLRKGDRVLVVHTYQGMHGGALGEWYSITTVGRGGKSPRDGQGVPLDMGRVVGVIEEVAG